MPIQTLRTKAEWLTAAPGAPSEVAGFLAVNANGRCVFHQSGQRTAPDAPDAPPAPVHGCAIHYAFGHAALPSACQHFPRECLIDPRGVFVTLSHYCPTAAQLLFDHSRPVEIVEGPPAIPDGEPEGLDARDALPPCLSSEVLMDHSGYGAWEVQMVRCLTASDGWNRLSPEQTLSGLEQRTGSLCRWMPGNGTISDAIRAIDWEPQAHAFASWMSYQGTGLRALIHRLWLVLAVLRGETIRVCYGEQSLLTPVQLKQAIRETDLFLIHLVDRVRLARQLSQKVS